MRVGLVSDTHGLLRDSVPRALAGVDLILHAGDVGGDAILDALALVAPVHAVYGNTDSPDDPRLSRSIDLVLEGVAIHLSHGHEVGRPTPERLLAAYDADVIVYGHTHIPLVHRADSRLVVNPGAAGPRRFRLQPSLAVLTLESGGADVQSVPLDD